MGPSRGCHSTGRRAKRRSRPTLAVLSLYRASLVAPDSVAMRYFDGTVTYGALDAMSDAFAVWLAEAGVSRGDRVGLILQNTPAFVIGLIAAWKLGATAVPGNSMYRAAELTKLFGDYAPLVVVCHEGQFEAVREGLAAAAKSASVVTASADAFQSRADGRVIRDRAQTPEGATDFEAALAAFGGRAPPLLEVDGEEVGMLLYTSGTTGEPKGVMLRHSSMAFSSQVIRDWCGLGSRTNILAIAPLFHVTGVICHIGAALISRGAMTLHYRFEPSLVLDAIRAPAHFHHTSITAFNALMSSPYARNDFEDFDVICSGGAPIAPALANAFFQRFGRQDLAVLRHDRDDVARSPLPHRRRPASRRRERRLGHRRAGLRNRSDHRGRRRSPAAGRRSGGDLDARPADHGRVLEQAE